jgi:pyocin large subunit-like protein
MGHLKWAALAVVAAGLTACSDPAKAPAREHAEAEAAQLTSAPLPDRAESRRDYASTDRRSAPEREDGVDPRDLPPPMHEGRPLWSATSRLTSEENAERAFRSHGEAFGAKSVDDYVDAAHAFLKSPPADVLTLTRTNGDTLYYAPKQNVFAVAREDGAPRTLFKPDEGMAYWREQEQREQARADRRDDRQTARQGRDGGREDRG